MRVRLMLNGDLKLQDENGILRRIGPEHPDYRRYLGSVRIGTRKLRTGGIGAVLVGLGLLWLNWRLVVTRGHYYLLPVFFGPTILLSGLFVLLWPGGAGPARGKTGPRSPTVVVFSFITLMLGAIALNWYLLAGHQP